MGAGSGGTAGGTVQGVRAWHREDPAQGCPSLPLSHPHLVALKSCRPWATTNLVFLAVPEEEGTPREAECTDPQLYRLCSRAPHPRNWGGLFRLRLQWEKAECQSPSLTLDLRRRQPGWPLPLLPPAPLPPLVHTHTGTFATALWREGSRYFGSHSKGQPLRLQFHRAACFCPFGV